MRIENPVPPTIERVKPGNKMKIKVVPAGVAVKKFGHDGHGGREKNDCQPTENRELFPGPQVRGTWGTRVRALIPAFMV